MTIDDFLFSENNMTRCINLQCARFERYINKIEKSKSLSRRLEYAKKALDIANNGSTRYYSSDVIESVFLELAQQNQIELSSNIIPDSVLHVASELYDTGGHTRILERWIQNAPNGQKNDLFLTRTSDIPNTVKSIVGERNGEIIMPEKSAADIERAMQLRQIASRYDRIILHIHMDDYIPLIAFGTDDFSRPVFLFNHADHRFWIGVSISDYVINFRDFGRKISENYRGVNNTFDMPLIMDIGGEHIISNPTVTKRELSIPVGRPVLFTAGSAQKYRPLLQLDFSKYLDKIIKKIPNIFVVAIGPKFRSEFGNNMICVPPVTHDAFTKYLQCADVVVDSFPFSGGTALLDAVSATKPVLSVKCATGQLDYITKSSAYCDDVSQLVERTCQLINSYVERKKNISDVQNLIKKENKSVWIFQRDLLYSKNVRHSIYKFHSSKKQISILDYFMFQNTCNIKRKLHIPHVCDVFRFSCAGKKHYAFIGCRTLRETR